VNQTQLTQSIDASIRSLNPEEVVHVAYNIGNDSTDDPAIFFRIVLTDPASREDRLAEVTQRVEAAIVDSIRPMEDWGLFPYFSFRSFSEQRALSDPKWS
jgi:predicted transcriptional regulator